MRRRSMLAGLAGLGATAGLAGLGATASLPALAQAIRPQSDPYAQVDPYDDPRNGFPSERGAGERSAAPSSARPQFSEALQQSPEEEAREIAVGRVSFAHNLKKWGGPVSDARLQSALREFFLPMTKAAKRSHLPWEVALVNNDEPNACAMAGGKVLVNYGVFLVSDHPGDAAATLAHEIGHVDWGHVVPSANFARVASLIDSAGIDAALKGAIDGFLPGASENGFNAAALFKLAYSRRDEFQADEHVLYIFEKMGIDLNHAIHDQENFMLFNKLTGGQHLNTLMMSHPPDEERVANIRRLVQSYPGRVADRFQFTGWETLKAAFPTIPQLKRA